MFRKIKRIYRQYLSLLAARYYDYPAKDLKLIGVTGTSGKSTTSAMIFDILRSNGYKVGIVSTVGAIAGNEEIETGFHVTTPDPVDMQKYLRKMKDNGVEYVVIETSSHALDQGRLGFLKFRTAVFTNIKRDHLDYHKTWGEYARAKCRLIDALEDNGTVIYNFDDQKSYKFLKEYILLRNKIHGQKIKEIEYSVSQQLTDVELGKGFITYKYKSFKFNIPVIGEYNVENSFAATLAAISLGVTANKAAATLSEYQGVVGRMEIMQRQPFFVIVDFAHNADSLERSLDAAKDLLGRSGRLITIFGSAGLRDVEKRGAMGEISGNLSDITIVTAEDPRIEELYDINSQIIKGAEKTGAKLIKRFATSEEFNNYMASDKTKIEDKELMKEVGLETTPERENIIYSFDENNTNSRYDAIQFAIRIARAGDVVIAEGKGHEKSLAFGSVEYHFTDQEAVKKALERMTA
ncbi:MAG: UDP-N-acetylmuramoyl-L-alanyl-D-glutamate--2,6-diaminopimelate ligase [Candidatus Dojkabacteria bacterium]